MKITMLSLSSLLASIMLLAAAQSVAAVSPPNPAVSNCKAQADEYDQRGITAASLADYQKAHLSKSHVEVEILNIGGVGVPVFTMPRMGRSPGPDDATLIVLLHSKTPLPTETPVVDAICHDQNHSFAIAKDTITFATDEHERLYLRFRLDPVTLPNTKWKDSPDSVDMVPDPPSPASKQRWCDDGKHKDVGVEGTDMWFTMCKNFGNTRRYKYTLYLTVNGSPVSIDPIIIHEPQ